MPVGGMTIGGNGTVRIALGLDAAGFHFAVQMSSREIGPRSIAHKIVKAEVWEQIAGTELW